MKEFGDTDQIPVENLSLGSGGVLYDDSFSFMMPKTTAEKVGAGTGALLGVGFGIYSGLDLNERRSKGRLEAFTQKSDFVTKMANEVSSRPELQALFSTNPSDAPALASMIRAQKPIYALPYGSLSDIATKLEMPLDKIQNLAKNTGVIERSQGFSTFMHYADKRFPVTHPFMFAFALTPIGLAAGFGYDYLRSNNSSNRSKSSSLISLR